MNRPVTSYLLPVVLTLFAGCGRDSPIEPAMDATPQAVAADAAAPLLIQDMVSDPLFRELMGDIANPGLAMMLHQGVDALSVGHRARGVDLIAAAQTIAQDLADDPKGSVETMILWSVLERYLETAGVL